MTTGNDTTTDRTSATVTPIVAARRRLEDPTNNHIERLATVFESSARRWELMVYPSLFAFIILAGYGFYLIFSLTRDVASLARNVHSLTTTIETSLVDNMDSITSDMSMMTSSMDTIAIEMSYMSSNLGEIAVGMDTITDEMTNLGPMRVTMDELNKNTVGMVASTNSIRHEMGAMNYNIGRPISQMSNFFPW
jgi:methyl-accepting chemotaxis protein